MTASQRARAIREARPATIPLGDVSKSRIFTRSGVEHFTDGQLAYSVWLGTPHSVIRVAGDTRPVYSWEFSGC